MSEQKHTPGPWESLKEGDRFEILYSGKDPYCHVARIAKTYRHPNEEEDARLITAAPDLLEAAKELLSMLKSHEITANAIGTSAWLVAPMSRPIDALIAAIAKAEGAEE